MKIKKTAIIAGAAMVLVLGGVGIAVAVNESREPSPLAQVGALDENGAAAAEGGIPSTVESATPTAAAPMTGTADYAAQQASAEAAALAAVGSGRVTEFDISDDRDHFYEVEVTLADGRDVDVELDADFVVLTVDEVRV